MKNKKLKNWLLAFSGATILASGVYAYACADGGDWGINYLSSFTPEAFADSTYLPMFYDNGNFFYNGNDMYNSGMHNDEIVSDWKNYLGAAMKPKALTYYLLNDSISSDLDRIATAVTKNETTRTPYNIDLKNEKVKKFVEFLYIAKNLEKYTSQSYNYWDYDNRTVYKADDKIVANLENYYNKVASSDSFFKNRIWFQVMKAKFYSTNQKATLSYFDATAADQPKNTLYYRALAYKAGYYYNNKDFVTSNKIFAEVFNASPALRQMALYNFKPMATKELQNVLAQTKDKDIQAAIYAINGYYGNESASMQAIYKLNPKSEHLNFLLTRWVNIQEVKAGDYLLKEGNQKAAAHYKAIKSKVDINTLKWIDQVASKPEVLDNPALWSMANGYMNLLLGNFTQAEQGFVKAKTQVKSNDLVKDQIRLLQLINNVSQVKKVDTAVENQLLPELKWLFSLNYNDILRFSYSSDWIKKYLSEVYLSNGQPLMAELVNTGGDFYLKNSNSKDMEAFFKKTNKSPWEAYFASIYDYNLSDIYESRAIYLFYQNKIDDAIATLQLAAPVTTKDYDGKPMIALYKNEPLKANPFNGKIKDCNDCDFAAKQTVTYTKLTFLQKVKELQEKIAQNDDVYNNALLLGNAFYSATYYGNARSFYYNNIVGEQGGNSLQERNIPILYNMKYAKMYYEMAAKAASNKEQKAKMAYMLAKVERNDFYYTSYFSKNTYYYAFDDNNINFKAWKGFQDLKNNYSDTKYYKDVIAECGYFRKYLGLQ